VDCRTARTYLNNGPESSSEEQQAYQGHLATCAACRDDAADPFSALLVGTTRELAQPAPDFTARLMQRLPAESPLALAQADARRRRLRQRLMVVGAVALPLIALLIGALGQPLWTGTTLGLTAASIRTVMVAALGPLFVMLASAAVIVLLLQAVLRKPSAGQALLSAAVAVLLLLSTGAATLLNDGLSAGSGARGGTTTATVFRAIDVQQPVSGDVASLAGNIAIGSQVRGNVASVLGHIALAPQVRVDGDVLGGAGQSGVEGAVVSGTVRQGPGGLVTAAAGLGATAGTASPTAVRALSILLAALVTLVLAALAIMLWPQRTLRTSHLLPAQPWTALGLGLLITALLILLALPPLALLAATVVGLLLVPVLLFLAHLPYVQGLAAVGQALGQRLTGATTLSSSLWGVAAQLVVVLGLALLSPLVGLAAYYLLASLGLGAQLLERRTLL
jgi:hypothetical protein